MTDKSQQGEKIRQKVKDQYEKFPYPAGDVDLHQFIQQKNRLEGCPSLWFHWYWPYATATDDLDILIAGCGTNQAPKYAINLPNARITAIDISEQSINHTQMLIDKHGITNIDLHRMPIESVSDLGNTYDLIISTGVLHHLPEPAVGLRALRNVLRQNGSMFLMLYSKYGRDGIYYMQDMFRRMGITAANATREDLDGMVSLIEALPPYHSLTAKRLFFNDLSSHIELVDLFLHPQDVAFSIPDIYSLLEKCGMNMQKMLHRAQYDPVCTPLINSPFFPRIHSLPLAERFAIGELFQAGTIMHYFVACRDDRSDETYVTDITGDNWKDLIPIRQPMTTVASIDTPEGKRTYLFSPQHQFRNISYPVDEILLEFFNSIDGVAPAGQLIEELLPRMGEAYESDDMRLFLEDLETYDYIFFRGQSDA
jgi:2-polyprenyl-3-methyl-5-hydroxy-6-metoxy-1,4-benzoquinol methylase